MSRVGLVPDSSDTVGAVGVTVVKKVLDEPAKLRKVWSVMA